MSEEIRKEAVYTLNIRDIDRPSVSAPHVDAPAYSEIPHSDSDPPHSDTTHTDVGHGDSNFPHSDSDPPHVDWPHTDTPPYDYFHNQVDLHADSGPGHFDWNDLMLGHIDDPGHTDTPWWEHVYSCPGCGHSDDPHSDSDPPHSDSLTHNDFPLFTLHTDVDPPHSDGIGGHSNTAHGDTPYDDWTNINIRAHKP